jgi:hypothetical protein
MTARRAPHLSMAHRWRSETPAAERLLHALGAQPAFADAVIGDLAEERARRTAAGGARAANWWYAREALRSAPHLFWNAVRHGGPGGRARAACAIAVVALVPAVVSLALLGEAAPARVVVDGQRGGFEGIVLNTTQPVQLATHVLDAKGRLLHEPVVRYEWVAGTPLRVEPSGVVTCTGPGDATLRASVGAVQTTVLLRCRPVKEFRAAMWIPLYAGGPGRDLKFIAIGPDDRLVPLLAGELRVHDSTVATLTGTRIRPVKPGHTVVTMRIGNGETVTSVIVYEPVSTLDDLRPDQRFVAAPVTVARGDTIRWSLPTGPFWLFYDRESQEAHVPKFAVDGPVRCTPDFGPAMAFVSCLVRGPGASLRIMHPGTGTPVIAGHLALERAKQP